MTDHRPSFLQGCSVNMSNLKNYFCNLPKNLRTKMAGYDAVETKENLNEEVYTIFFKSSFDKQDFGI